MKEVNTTPGKYQVVRSENGCTVTQTMDNGQRIEDNVPAGESTAVFAFTSKIEVDDDSAVVREVFKLAPQQRLAILGVLGGNVPAWFKALETELTALLDGSKFELAWLASKNTLVVHTDRADDTQLEAVTALLERTLPQDVEVVRYNHNMEISWRDKEFKYAACKTWKEMLAVNEDYKNDLTSDGEWVYELPEMEWFNHEEPGNYSEFGCFRSGNIVKCDLSMPKNKSNYCFVSQCKKVKSVKLHTPEAVNCNAMIDCKGIEEVEIYAPKGECGYNGLGFDGFATLRRAKIYMPKMIFYKAAAPFLEELEITFAYNRYLNQGVNGSILNAESAIRLLDSFPQVTAGGNPFTIGIHVDHQNNEEVLAAIERAVAKGCELEVQWNGTPTAQTATTYGLRKPPIYARVSEHELPDGTTERVLDWGHYVTDPSGYEEFRSVEAAREYFGLPDEDLTNN